MACGRPVVTTDVGLVRRIVAHGVNGYVVERTPCAIAAGLRDLAAKSQTDLEAMGAAARRAAEAHSWHLKMPYWRNCLAAIV
jgi:glycosyltransferase involved in cell wall biosynthesis